MTTEYTPTCQPLQVEATVRAVQVDASSHCQLACPACPTATGETRQTLKAGHLKLSDFERLLDRNPEIAEVELSNYGEMFLNPQLPELLACAIERSPVRWMKRRRNPTQSGFDAGTRTCGNEICPDLSRGGRRWRIPAFPP